MDDLTGFQRDILHCINKHESDKPHGLGIKAKLAEYYEAEINHGRLYPNLDTLVQKQLVEKGVIDRRTNYYALTGLGEHELGARRQWENAV